MTSVICLIETTTGFALGVSSQEYGQIASAIIEADDPAVALE